jgi:anti-sigma regulatory factor (Ser/Thr protein kinase)
MAELARLTAWADDFIHQAGLSNEVAFRLHLCLEEAVSNIIRHGNVTTVQQEIRVMLDEAEGSVIAQIEDDGQPFDPCRVQLRRPAASIEDAEAGGFGIPLMRRFASEITYERIGMRNRLVFKF